MKLPFYTLPSLAIVAAVIIATAQDLPPLPPADLSEVETVDTNSVFVLQPRPASYALQWNQTNSAAVHSWRIYAATNFSTVASNYRFYMQTTTTNVLIPIDAPQRFFIVTAVGTNGLESGFNAR